MATCAAIKTNGEQCQGTALPDRTYCFAHAPKAGADPPAPEAAAAPPPELDPAEVERRRQAALAKATKAKHFEYAKAKVEETKRLSVEARIQEAAGLPPQPPIHLRRRRRALTDASIIRDSQGNRLDTDPNFVYRLVPETDTAGERKGNQARVNRRKAEGFAVMTDPHTGEVIRQEHGVAMKIPVELEAERTADYHPTQGIDPQQYFAARHAVEMEALNAKVGGGALAAIQERGHGTHTSNKLNADD